MVEKWVRKYSIKDKRLNYQFRIFSLLLLLMPTAVFMYIAGSLASYSELLQVKYMVPFIFSIIIVLCVLALLQSVFSHLSAISLAMTKDPELLTAEMQEMHGAYELRGIADSFGKLLEKYQQTSNDLQRRALELLLIKELAEQTSANLDITKLLQILLDKVMQVNRARIGSVFLVDEEGKNFRIIGTRGRETTGLPERPSPSRIPLSARSWTAARGPSLSMTSKRTNVSRRETTRSTALPPFCHCPYVPATG